MLRIYFPWANIIQIVVGTSKPLTNPRNRKAHERGMLSNAVFSTCEFVKTHVCGIAIESGLVYFYLGQLLGQLLRSTIRFDK